MSAMSPIIKALRVEAKALLEQGKELGEDGQHQAAFVILAISAAKVATADELDAAERAHEGILN